MTSHYQGPHEPIDVIEAWSPTWPADSAFHIGCAIKYIARCGRKHESPASDLRKAAWYLTRAADMLERACSTDAVLKGEG